MAAVDSHSDTLMEVEAGMAAGASRLDSDFVCGWQVYTDEHVVSVVCMPLSCSRLRLTSQCFPYTSVMNVTHRLLFVKFWGCNTLWAVELGCLRVALVLATT